MRNGLQVQINQTTSNHATVNLQPGEIPGGGKTLAQTGSAGRKERFKYNSTYFTYLR